MPIDPDTLAKSVARLEGVDPVDTGLDAALELAVAETDELFGVDGAGLMLIDGAGVLRYIAASDEPGRMLEAIQEQVGEGPCVDAFLEDGPVKAGDLGADPRWPSAGPLAAGHGVCAVLGDFVVDRRHREELEDLLVLPELIGRLPERERRIVLLRYVEELTQDEIAARMQISQMHVSRLLRRAIERMRCQLVDQ